MQTWSTELAEPADRRAYWADAVRNAIYELDFQSEDPNMSASLRQCELGAIRLSSVSIASGHQITRSVVAVRHNRFPHFNLNYLKKGAFSVSHCGHDLWIGPGDIVLLDNRQPYRVTSTSLSEHISVHIPVEWLQSMMPQPEAGVAQVIRAGTPWQSVLASMLEDAPRLDAGSIAHCDLGAQQIAGALSIALGPNLSDNSNHTRLLLLRAQEFVTMRYHDHDLSAEAIAAAMGISVRYLYRLFARESTTLGREILRIRLEKAAAKMREKDFDGVSIAEISWRCGFSDPSYFSKCFRSQFRQAPGSFRQSAQAARQEHN